MMTITLPGQPNKSKSFTILFKKLDLLSSIVLKYELEAENRRKNVNLVALIIT